MSLYFVKYANPNNGQINSVTFQSLTELHNYWNPNSFGHGHGARNLTITVDGKEIARFPGVIGPTHSLFYQALDKNQFGLIEAMENDQKKAGNQDVSFLNREELSQEVTKLDFSGKRDTENQTKRIAAVIRQGGKIEAGYVNRGLFADPNSKEIIKALVQQASKSPMNEAGQRFVQYIKASTDDLGANILPFLDLNDLASTKLTTVFFELGKKGKSEYKVLEHIANKIGANVPGYQDIELRVYLLKEAERIENSWLKQGAPEKAKTLRALATDQTSKPDAMWRALAEKRPTNSWFNSSNKEPTSISNMPNELKVKYSPTPSEIKPLLPEQDQRSERRL
jgi:hypothetical protein